MREKEGEGVGLIRVGVGVEQKEGREGVLAVKVGIQNGEGMVLPSSMVVSALQVDSDLCFFASFSPEGVESQNVQGWSLVACIFLLGGCGGLCPCCSSLPALSLPGSERQAWPKVSDVVLSGDLVKEAFDG